MEASHRRASRRARPVRHRPPHRRRVDLPPRRPPRNRHHASAIAIVVAAARVTVRSTTSRRTNRLRARHPPANSRAARSIRPRVATAANTTRHADRIAVNMRASQARNPARRRQRTRRAPPAPPRRRPRPSAPVSCAVCSVTARNLGGSNRPGIKNAPARSLFPPILDPWGHHRPTQCRHAGHARLRFRLAPCDRRYVVEMASRAFACRGHQRHQRMNTRPTRFEAAILSQGPLLAPRP